MIPTRERCAACQQPSPVSFWVPDETWAMVVHQFFQNSILCLPCFVSRADEKLIEWEKDIKLYPISLATQLRDVRGMALPGPRCGICGLEDHAGNCPERKDNNAPKERNS